MFVKKIAHVNMCVLKWEITIGFRHPDDLETWFKIPMCLGTW
jgi:hypothetical protein